MTRKIILLAIAIIVLVSLNWFNEARACETSEKPHSNLERTATCQPVDHVIVS